MMTKARKKAVPAIPSEVIKIAVLAVGGQGGGVLTNWIADLGTLAGHDVQMTSVAGVAQRTGATIYYVEMAPKKDQRKPVFALSPSPGDLDILIAAELVEAGRAVLRGFVTPDRTTLIASTHRILAVAEKQVPGDGRSDSRLVEHEIRKAALKAVCFDMERIAGDAGSMISASLFGGLARSGALPFETSLYEEVIRTSGRGVEQSLAAFRGALNFSDGTEPVATSAASPSSPAGPRVLLNEWEKLIGVVRKLPDPCHEMTLAGLRKVVDHQDLEYGSDYLKRLSEIHELDNSEWDYALTLAGAKHIANAMCYDDILRIADLKTRSSRERRLRKEQQASAAQIVHVTEYFHPRAEELCGTLPASLGGWIESTPWAFSIAQKLFNRGRRVRTDGLAGFLMLWLAGSLRPLRRRLLRHRYEMEHLNRLLETVRTTAPTDYDLAVEILNCQRLVKGYADTHARGRSKFAKVVGALELLEGRPDAAEWIRRLKDVALKDEKGEALDGALATVASFSG